MNQTSELPLAGRVAVVSGAARGRAALMHCVSLPTVQTSSVSISARSSSIRAFLPRPRANCKGPRRRLRRLAAGPSS